MPHNHRAHQCRSVPMACLGNILCVEREWKNPHAQIEHTQPVSVDIREPAVVVRRVSTGGCLTQHKHTNTSSHVHKMPDAHDDATVIAASQASHSTAASSRRAPNTHTHTHTQCVRSTALRAKLISQVSQPVCVMGLRRSRRGVLIDTNGLSQLISTVREREYGLHRWLSENHYSKLSASGTGFDLNIAIVINVNELSHKSITFNIMHFAAAADLIVLCIRVLSSLYDSIRRPTIA